MGGATAIDAEPLLDHGAPPINRHRNPDLRLHGVLSGIEKRVDAPVLLDPFEE